MPERRTAPRKKFILYLRVMDDDSQEQLGHMVEVSATGLQLETSAPVLVERDYYLRLELTAELADRPYIVFIARSKWCKADNIQPNLFHVGFAIREILPEDRQIFVRIIQKYGV
ncbi:MAG: PilZ domain-containing protein [Anaerolineales bacterium]|nr:PilZ domain-containing protein [Anaerolineales bacterium]